MKVSPGRLVPSAALLAALAAAGPAVAVPVVGVRELPPVEVRADRIFPPPERWLHGVADGVEVLSSTSQRETRRFVREFLLLRSAIDAVLPGLVGRGPRDSIDLVLCGRAPDFGRFLPPGREAERFRLGTLFLEDHGRVTIVVDLAVSALELAVAPDGPGDSAAEPDGAGEDGDEAGIDVAGGATRGPVVEVDVFREFSSEYFRHLLRGRMHGRVIPCFEEGVVRLLGGIEVDRRAIHFARIGDGFDGSRVGDFGELLQGRSLSPLLEMMERGQGAAVDRQWSAQCFAWVHMCLYGRGLRHRAGFLRLVDRLSVAPVSEALVEECFGLSMRRLQAELRGYVEFTDHKAIRLVGRDGATLVEPPRLELGDAADGVAGRLVGEALGKAGRHAEGGLVLTGPYARGAREPELLAALGLEAVRQGRNDRAETFLAAAVAGGVRPARAHLALARLRLAGALEATGGGGLDSAAIARVLEPLRTAREAGPPDAEVAELTARVWLRALRLPGPDDLRVVNQGAVNFPSDPNLIVPAAELNLRTGGVVEAAELVRHGLEVFSDARIREALEGIRARLPSTGPSPEE